MPLLVVFLAGCGSKTFSVRYTSGEITPLHGLAPLTDAKKHSGGLSGGVFANVDDFRDNLAGLLAKVVEEAANDPDLLSAVGRQ